MPLSIIAKQKKMQLDFIVILLPAIVLVVNFLHDVTISYSQICYYLIAVCVCVLMMTTTRIFSYSAEDKTLAVAIFICGVKIYSTKSVIDSKNKAFVFTSRWTIGQHTHKWHFLYTAGSKRFKLISAWSISDINYWISVFKNKMGLEPDLTPEQAKLLRGHEQNQGYKNVWDKFLEKVFLGLYFVVMIAVSILAIIESAHHKFDSIYGLFGMIILYFCYRLLFAQNRLS